jgi:hypothetical protein
MVQLEVTSAEWEQEVHVGYIYIERTGERHRRVETRARIHSAGASADSTVHTVRAKALSLVVGV